MKLARRVSAPCFAGPDARGPCAEGAGGRCPGATVPACGWARFTPRPPDRRTRVLCGPVPAAPVGGRGSFRRVPGVTPRRTRVLTRVLGPFHFRGRAQGGLLGPAGLTVEELPRVPVSRSSYIPTNSAQGPRPRVPPTPPPLPPSPLPRPVCRRDRWEVLLPRGWVCVSLVLGDVQCLSRVCWRLGSVSGETLFKAIVHSQLSCLGSVAVEGQDFFLY